MFKSVNKWFFTPGRKSGQFVFDGTLAVIARALSWRTKYTSKYHPENQVLAILSPGPLDEDDRDPRKLGRAEALLALMPAMIGFAIMTYADVAGDFIAGDVGTGVHLAGTLVCYLFAAGSVTNLRDVRVKITERDPA